MNTEKNFYKVEIGAMVTVNITKELFVSGTSEEEAIKNAKKDFDTYINEMYPWADYDEYEINEVSLI